MTPGRSQRDSQEISPVQKKKRIEEDRKPPVHGTSGSMMLFVDILLAPLCV